MVYGYLHIFKSLKFCLIKKVVCTKLVGHYISSSRKHQVQDYEVDIGIKLRARSDKRGKAEVLWLKMSRMANCVVVLL